MSTTIFRVAAWTVCLFLLFALFSTGAEKKDALTVWAFPASALDRGNGVTVRVGVRVDKPTVWCPALIYELRGLDEDPMTSRPLNVATVESDCAPGEAWEPPNPRTYLFGEGDWVVSVRFCASGLAEDRKSCRPGPGQVRSVTIRIR